MEIHHRAYVAKLQLIIKPQQKSAILNENTFAALQADPKYVTFQVEEGNWSEDNAFRDDPILKTIDGEIKTPKAFCHWFTIASARKEASDERKLFVGPTKVAHKAVHQYNDEEARNVKWYTGWSTRRAIAAAKVLRTQVLNEQTDFIQIL